MPTTITTPAKMTDAQFATILFFAGGPTPRRQGIRVSSGMQTDAACIRRGWLVETEQHPYKKPTHKGMEAAGLYIDQHDGHALDIQETHWHCHTCRVYQAPHTARPAPAPVHLFTGLSRGNTAVCGEPVEGAQTAPDIKDVTCTGCQKAYGDYSIALRNELQRFADREAPYDTEPESDPRRDAATARRMGVTKADAVAVLEHLVTDATEVLGFEKAGEIARDVTAANEAVVVADAYRAVGGEIDPQTAAAADSAPNPEMVAAGRDYLAREQLTQQILTLIGWLTDGHRVIRTADRRSWVAHEVRPGAECRPVPDGVVDEALRRHAVRTHTNLAGQTTLHLPAIVGSSRFTPPPPPATIVVGHRYDAGRDREHPACIAFRTSGSAMECGLSEQVHLHTEYPTRAVDEVEIADRKLHTYLDRASDFGYLRCPTPHLTTNAVGYVTRQTVAPDGKLIQRKASVGVDLVVFPCHREGGFDPAYLNALDAAKTVRAVGQAWAVVDTLWPCGHRS